MSDLERLGQMDFIHEMQRLHAAQVAALRSKDADAIEHAAAEMALFLNYNRLGRLAEYFASRQGDRS